MEIILNKCYGGFGVSDKAIELYAEKKNIKRLFRYEYECDSGIFKKVQLNAKIFGRCIYATKDYGDSIPESTLDKKDIVNLSEENRTDPVLIEVVKELGEEASDEYARLKVVEIPDDLDWVIDDYDGFETLHQRTQIW